MTIITALTITRRRAILLVKADFGLNIAQSSELSRFPPGAIRFMDFF
jgi:hypothetical protein